MTMCYVTLILIAFYFQIVFLHVLGHLSEVTEVSLGRHMILIHCCNILQVHFATGGISESLLRRDNV